MTEHAGGGDAGAAPSAGRSPAHPLESIRPGARARVLVLLVFASAVFLWMFWRLGPRGTSGSVFGLSMAGSLAEAQSIVEGWTPAERATAGLAVGLDFLFIPVYVSAIGLACLWPTRIRALRLWGVAFAWVAYAGGLADIAENVAMARMLRGTLTPRWASILQLSSWGKWGLAGAAALFGLTAIFVAGIRGLLGEPGPTDGVGSEEAGSSTSTRVHEVTASASDDPGPWARLTDWFWGRRVDPIVRDPQPAQRVDGRLGIGCSGGGIRSAAYCLGALQALDLKGEVSRARYLSAVSGGSYTAAAYSILRGRSDRSLVAPMRGSTAQPEKPFAPGTPEEEYLRNRTTYLAPGLGGVLYLVWRVLRGLAMNLLVIVSALYVAGFAVGALLSAFLLQPKEACPGTVCAFSVPARSLAAVGLLFALAGLSGGIDLLVRPPEGRARFLEAWSARFLWAAGIAALVLIALPYAVTWIEQQVRDARGVRELIDWPALQAWVAGWAGIFAALAGALGIRALGLGRPSRRPVSAAEPREDEGGGRGIREKVRALVVKVLVALVGPLLAAGTFAVFAFIGSFRGDRFRPQFVLVAAVGWLVFVALYGDLTRWSMHPFYKRRLSSVFALERRRLADGTIIAAEVPYDIPVRFTGLRPVSPELVVCAAANVSEFGAAPTSRPVTPFNFSRSSLYGGRLLGELEMAAYQRAADRAFRRDITVPAAVAMSGAAISPSMGKHSRRWATFLLAVANVRLGVWLPNPRAALRERSGGRRLRSRVGPHYLVRELLGKNSYRSDYVYVTDGGHYENLGLVELLRRGCTEIYCLDASGDKTDTFFTFGEAVAIARSELEVEIEISPERMKPAPGERFVPADCAVGNIWFKGDREAGRDPGRLVLAKAGVTSDAPADVRAYMEKDRGFPTHGTAEQLYTEERFEAYRALGEHAGRHAYDAMLRGSPVRLPPSAQVAEADR